MNTGLRLVLVTCSDASEAERLARTLVEERLAACVNIVPSIRSIYRWNGKVEDAQETLLVIKTSPEYVNRLHSRVSELHSYEVPEFVSLDPSMVSEKYLSWARNALE
jgi:periplasmic divalent cation tolerance protein